MSRQRATGALLEIIQVTLVVAIVAAALFGIPPLVDWLDTSGWQKLPPQFDHGRPANGD